MCVLDDVCATMHAQGEGADQKLLEVCYVAKFNRFSSSLLSTPNFSLHNTYYIIHLVMRK